MWGFVLERLLYLLFPKRYSEKLQFERPPESYKIANRWCRRIMLIALVVPATTLIGIAMVYAILPSQILRSWGLIERLEPEWSPGLAIFPITILVIFGGLPFVCLASFAKQKLLDLWPRIDVERLAVLWATIAMSIFYVCASFISAYLMLLSYDWPEGGYIVALLLSLNPAIGLIGYFAGETLGLRRM